MKVGLLLASQGTQNLAISALALLLPVIRRDLDLSFSEAGMLAVAASISYAFMQFPAGLFADRWGPRRLFFVGTMVTALTTLCLAVISSFPLLIASQALSGVSRSLMFTPAMMLISSQFRAERRATAMSALSSSMFITNIILGAFGPAVERHFGWQALFIILSAIGILASITCLRFGPEEPPLPPRTSVSLSLAWALTKHKVMLLAGTIQFVRLAIATGMLFWLPSFLIEERGMTIARAGMVMAMAAAITAVSNISVAYLSDRLAKPLIVVSTALFILFTCLVSISLTASTGLTIFFVFLLSVVVQCYFGPLFHYPISKLGGEHAGTITGISNTFANLGAFTFTYGFGFVKDLTGSFTIAFQTLAFLCVIAFCATIALRRGERYIAMA